jgi:hypothetical protein
MIAVRMCCNCPSCLFSKAFLLLLHIENHSVLLKVAISGIILANYNSCVCSIVDGVCIDCTSTAGFCL